MKWREAVGGSVLLALAGCTAIAGYRDYTYAPRENPTCEPVALPTHGDGLIRLVNAGTSDAASDFCVRATGTSDWGTPVFYAGAKAGCATGLAYATATVPFAVPSGQIDVEAVAPGASCASTPTSTAHAIAVGSSAQGGSVVTVLRMGGGSSAEQIVAHAESTGVSKAGGELVRIVNGLSGGASINMGVVSGNTLPQTIPSFDFPAAIASGGVAPLGQTALGPVDALGYLDIEIYGAQLGLAISGSTSAFAIFGLLGSFDTDETVFAIGDPQNNGHPIRALECTDGRPAAGAPDAGQSGLLAACTLTALPTLSVDTVNAALYGAAASFEVQRRAAVYAAIAARQSDVMCLAEVDTQADKDGIIAAAKAWFPYSYYITTDLSTQPSDPTQEDGGTPAVSTTPPCGPVDPTKVQNIFKCTATHCSEDGGLGSPIVTDSCLGAECTLPFAQIYEDSLQDDECFDCIIDYLTSFSTLTEAQTACTTDPHQGMAFTGQSPGMILSHYPLANTDSIVLPSTNWRRQVLYAEVQLPDAPVDFYCGQFSPPAIDADQPYDGYYGADKTTNLADGGVAIENGYEDEQNVQVKRLIAYVTQKSKATGRPAIISGFWDSSVLASDAQGNVLTNASSPEVMQAMDSQYGGPFMRADPQGYQAFCDECPQNPYYPGELPLDVQATFLFQYPPGSTTDESIWGTDDTVPIVGNAYNPAPDGGVGPPFEVYPRNVRLVRPRPQ